jgi:hypothetical protein
MRVRRTHNREVKISAFSDPKKSGWQVLMPRIPSASEIASGRGAKGGRGSGRRSNGRQGPRRGRQPEHAAGPEMPEPAMEGRFKNKPDPSDRDNAVRVCRPPLPPAEDMEDEGRGRKGHGGKGHGGKGHGGKGHGGKGRSGKGHGGNVACAETRRVLQLLCVDCCTTYAWSSTAERALHSEENRFGPQDRRRRRDRQGREGTRRRAGCVRWARGPRRGRGAILGVCAAPCILPTTELLPTPVRLSTLPLGWVSAAAAPSRTGVGETKPTKHSRSIQRFRY